MIILRNKTFAEGGESSTGKKLLKGAIATTAIAGAGALGLKGATKGIFGKGIQKSTGNAVMKAGTKVQNAASKASNGKISSILEKTGNKLIDKGADVKIAALK